MTTRIINGDCRGILPTLPADSFDCIVTSPPYWGLRDYGVDGQIGLEPTMQGYLETMVGVCRELKRVLKPEGTFWLNVGSVYAGSGKGGNPPNSPHQKQATNAGSLSVVGGKRTIQSHLDQNARAYGNDGKGRKDCQRECYCNSCGLCFIYLAASSLKIKPKDLLLIPDLLALALQADGWFVRSEIIWHKLNPMPESVRDRPTCAHEKVWLLTKSERYFYDLEATLEPCSPNTNARLSQDVQNQIVSTRANGGAKTNGNMKAVGRKMADAGSGIKNNDSFNAAMAIMPTMRNMRNVWSIGSEPYKGAHFATMPPALAERCIKAGCPEGGMVLDPFFGAGTTGLVADRLGRNCVGIELNGSYQSMASQRINDDAPLFAEVAE
jgi:DNA modification methylase